MLGDAELMVYRGLRFLLVGVFVVASMGMFSGSASAATWSPYYYSHQDDGDKGGRSINEGTMKAEGVSVSAYFSAKGEILDIGDRFQNGRATVVRLWVGGGGPAVFYSNGRDTRFNLSYDEGQTVYLQVCTSASSNAKCTQKVRYSGVS